MKSLETLESGVGEKEEETVVAPRGLTRSESVSIWWYSHTPQSTTTSLCKVCISEVNTWALSTGIAPAYSLFKPWPRFWFLVSTHKGISRRNSPNHSSELWCSVPLGGIEPVTFRSLVTRKRYRMNYQFFKCTIVDNGWI